MGGKNVELKKGGPPKKRKCGVCLMVVNAGNSLCWEAVAISVAIICSNNNKIFFVNINFLIF